MVVVRHLRCRRRRMSLGLALYSAVAASVQSIPASTASASSGCHQRNERSVQTLLNTIRCGNSTPSMPNKKYTASAASAIKTINSIASKSRQQQQQPNLPNLMCESALMDKETNAIYWQGGSDIISTSLTKPYLTERGVLHVKATILSALLWLWIWGKVSRYLATTYFEPSNMVGVDSSSTTPKLLDRQLFTMAFTNPVLKSVATFLGPIVQFILLMIHSLLYLRLPRYSPKFLTCTILLYLIEAFSCSTRRYLAHAMNAPTEVEAYLERMRVAKPVVKWKVRCFHYEDRLRGLKEFGRKFDNVNKRLNEALNFSNSSSKSFGETPPLWLAKKIVTHEAVGTYEYASCEDHTVASLWKRSQSFSSTPHDAAPFSKLNLSKLLVLKDKRAREDYFAQQAAFVTLEGRKDVYAEFATSIEVEGFRPKLLAVRPVRISKASHISAALFRQHVYFIFTLLGLSLPYRIWFSKHCDEVKVTILKETGSSGPSPILTAEENESVEKSSSWFRWGRGAASSSSSEVVGSKRAQEQFRKNMQSFSLYGVEDTTQGAVNEVRRDRDEPHFTPTESEVVPKDKFQESSSKQPESIEWEPTEKLELQITRDKLQLMRNISQIEADDVAGDVTVEAITQKQEATVDEASPNIDVANRTATAPKPEMPNNLSNENIVKNDYVDDNSVN